MAEENNQQDVTAASSGAQVAEATVSGETLAHSVAPNIDSQAGNATGTEAGKRGTRAQKVGVVASDKMEKTVVVRVDRLIKHPKYRRYVRRTSKFMAHDETGAAIGDKVRIVETRPLSARKRWRVVEIVQKAEK
jgi:small subunit ribosomal protein S17